MAKFTMPAIPPNFTGTINLGPTFVTNPKRTRNRIRKKKKYPKPASVPAAGTTKDMSSAVAEGGDGPPTTEKERRCCGRWPGGDGPPPNHRERTAVLWAATGWGIDGQVAATGSGPGGAPGDDAPGGDTEVNGGEEEGRRCLQIGYTSVPAPTSKDMGKGDVVGGGVTAAHHRQTTTVPRRVPGGGGDGPPANKDSGSGGPQGGDGPGADTNMFGNEENERVPVRSKA
ncbi:hypothetical protein MMC16_007320 [Acarospora aff. strigata]|nr:hypothetical protein [Acarospora aff. strigata]